MEQLSKHSVCQTRFWRLGYRGVQVIGFLVVLLIACLAAASLPIRIDSAPPLTRADAFGGDVPSAAPSEALTPVPQVTGRRTRVETVTVSLGADGFRPTEVTQPQGIFFLMVENETGLDQVELRLDREAGGRIHQVDVPQRKRDWAEAFDLPPGRYSVTEANHPDWFCTITITPK